MDNKKVAIIGGGFAGLTAALRLSQKGHAVTVYEKDSELGGLVSGFEIEGRPLEKAYHFIYTSDSAMLSMAKELGIDDKLTFYNSSVSIYYDGKLYPFTTPADLLKFNPLPVIDRFRTGLAVLYLQHIKKWDPFTRITAYEWMKKKAGAKATKIIWEPLLKGKFGKYFDKVAMSWLWARIKIRANSKDSKKSGEQLGYFKGGFREFINKMTQRINENGGKIKAGITPVSIIKNDDGTVSVETKEGKESFGSVIAAVPTPVFADLIGKNNQVSGEYINKLKSIDYIGAVVMIFSSDQKISPYYWHNINDPKIPFLVFLSKTELIGTGHFNGKHVYYIGTYIDHFHRYFSENEGRIMEEWIQGLKTMFPDFNAGKIREKKLFRFKNAQHIVDLAYKEKKPAYESEIPNVYLANFSQIYPDDRGMNYAILEGEKIARMVNNNLK